MDQSPPPTTQETSNQVEKKEESFNEIPQSNDKSNLNEMQSNNLTPNGNNTNTQTKTNGNKEAPKIPPKLPPKRINNLITAKYASQLDLNSTNSQEMSRIDKIKTEYMKNIGSGYSNESKSTLKGFLILFSYFPSFFNKRIYLEKKKNLKKKRKKI